MEKHEAMAAIKSMAINCGVYNRQIRDTPVKHQSHQGWTTLCFGA